MKRKSGFSFCFGLFAMTAASALAQFAAPVTFDLSWNTIDSGGGRAAGAGFTLDATIGQPEAVATMRGGTFTMAGGFWPGVEPECAADVTGGGLVNIDDLVMVITSWGSCPKPCPPYCAADVNDNCIVNIDDLVTVITSWGACP